MGTITHAKISGKVDTPDATLIQPSDWNAVHVPSGTFPSDPHSHAESEVTNLTTDLAAKETPSGAQAKVDTHALTPHGGSPPAPIHLDLLLSTGITMTNAAVAGSEPPNGTCRRKIDLTNAAQFRGEFISSLNVATIQLRLQYSTDQSVWSDFGTDISAVTIANGLSVGTWENIPAGAKADVFIRPLIIGNGTLDPVIRLISVQVK